MALLGHNELDIYIYILFHHLILKHHKLLKFTCIEDKHLLNFKVNIIAADELVTQGTKS